MINKLECYICDTTNLKKKNTPRKMTNRDYIYTKRESAHA